MNGITKSKSTKLLSALLAVLMIVAMLPTTAFAWSVEEGTKCTSTYGDHYVGSDGEMFYSKPTTTAIFYNDDGSFYVKTYSSGNAKYKYMMIDGNGNQHHVYCIADLFKARETAPKQPPQSPNLANLLMKYLSVQREKSRKYSQRWQRQHATDELKTIAAAVNYLFEHGISNLDELDASLSSVSDKAYSIREGMKTAEQRMKELQKLIEYGKNYTEYKPIHDELKKLQNGWTNKRDKYEEAHRAELTLWDAANRYLHANLPKGTKTLPIAEWEQEYADLKTQRDSDYTKLKDTRTEVAELQKIRKCVDIALRADQPEQTQSRTKRHEQER